MSECVESLQDPHWRTEIRKMAVCRADAKSTWGLQTAQILKEKTPQILKSPANEADTICARHKE